MRRLVLMIVGMILFTVVISAGELKKQDFETVKVAEGVFAFIANESQSGVVQGNVVLIVGENSAMIVDSGQYPSLARRIAAKVRELTQKPVRFLVNTHWHGDHLLCNHLFKESFPGILVVTHEETAKNGVKYYGKFEEQVKGYPELIQKLREAVKNGKTKEGRVLTETQKFGYAVDADALEAVLSDVSGSKYEAAEATFQKEITFDLGQRTVRVLHLGKANTTGDALILIPDTKVLVTGDTVVYPTPYSFGSFHGEWIEVLKKMTRLGADTYIPGHGPVMKDDTYIQTLISLLQDVRTQVSAAVKENLTLEQVRERVQLEDWNQRLAGDDKYRRRAFHDFFLAPGIERAYKEAKGELDAE